MEKIDILKNLKDSWGVLKYKQADITRLEKELKKIDPKTELTVWDNAKRVAENSKIKYSTMDKTQVSAVTQKITEICEKRNLIESVTKEKFPEYTASVSVGQILNLLVNNK